MSIDLKRYKKELQHLINVCEIKHWYDLCRELEEIQNSYQEASRIRSFQYCVEKKEEIAKELFSRKNKTWRNSTTQENVQLFTKRELKSILIKMKSEKSSGVVGTPTEAIKIPKEISPEVILSPLKNTLRNKHFLKVWKKAKLILIPKESSQE